MDLAAYLYFDNCKLIDKLQNLKRSINVNKFVFLSNVFNIQTDMSHVMNRKPVQRLCYSLPR